MKIRDISMSVLFAAAMLALPAIASAAGHIAPTGVTRKKASQLVVWYDETPTSAAEAGTLFMVTNTSLDTAVNIHVQIFADDATDDDNRCREHDFTDTLTPTDTVLYVLRRLDDPDEDPTTIDNTITFTGVTFGGDNSGAPIPIDLDETRGFIVVTSVDTATLPRRAISHNYLFGTTYTWWNDSSENRTTGLEAMGRQAVNFATGALTAPGVLLDGINNGLRLLQPGLLQTAFTDQVFFGMPGLGDSHVVSIAFSDNYSDPSGEYRAEPATVTWDPLMFDQFERGTSCQQHVNFCFEDIGLNDDWDTEIDNSGGYDDERLCPAVSLEGTEDDTGWVKIAVSGISGLQNGLGAIAFEDEDDLAAGASWMHAE